MVQLPILTPSEFRALLPTIAASAGVYVDAVVAPDAAPVLLEMFFELNPEEEYIPLLRGTPYESLWKHMPYLRRMHLQSDFMEFVCSSALNWGFLSVTSVELALHGQHWQSLCEVVLPNSSKSFFRFQDPAPLALMLPTFSEKELQWFMGPAEQLFIPVCNIEGDCEWLHAVNPRLTAEPVENLKAYLPTPYPWWEVQNDHCIGMEQQKNAAITHNVVEYLKAEAPHMALYQEQTGGLEKKVAALVASGRKYGLSDPAHLQAFTILCIVHSFSDAEIGNEDFMFAMRDAAEDPTESLSRLYAFLQQL